MLADGAVTPGKWANPYVFSGYMNSNLSPSSGLSLIPIDTMVFDPNSDFNTSTNRYVVPVDGYYRFNYQAGFSAGATTYELKLYKNGSALRNSSLIAANSGTLVLTGTSIFKLNAGDYIQFYVNKGTSTTVLGAGSTRFEGELIATA